VRERGSTLTGCSGTSCVVSGSFDLSLFVVLRPVPFGAGLFLYFCHGIHGRTRKNKKNTEKIFATKSTKTTKSYSLTFVDLADLVARNFCSFQLFFPYYSVAKKAFKASGPCQQQSAAAER
jgi:hypothetical protein